MFDIYEGEGVPEGKRSIAFRFRFRDPARTLTDEQVDKAVEAILKTLKETFDVQFRG